MLNFGFLPVPAAALDQTPDQPDRKALVRLAHALYYGSRYWLQPEGGHAPYFEQLRPRYQTVYHDLAAYLVARRQRPGYQPASAVVEARLVAWLADTAETLPGLLYARGTNKYTLESVTAYVRQHYGSLDEGRARELAEQWMATVPAQEPFPWEERGYQSSIKLQLLA